jgi:hypothetical protein
MGKTVDEGDGRGTTFRKDFGFGLRSRVAAHPRAGEGACPHTVEEPVREKRCNWPYNDAIAAGEVGRVGTTGNNVNLGC